MNITRFSAGNVTLLDVNSADPIVKTTFERGQSYSSKHEAKGLFETDSIQISERNGGVLFRKPLGIREHILGLGEKAFEIDRRRVTVKMWNTDAYSYEWYTDPLYISIPFFISVEKGQATGYFVNSPSEVVFDIGVQEYDRILIFVPEKSVELYIISGPEIQEIMETYFALTGMPFLPPKWALGHQISRYSYYPQNTVIEIVKLHAEHGIPVSTIYLDIDYMQDRKLFSWDREKFPDPRKMIDELHSMGVKVVAIVDPCIKVDQNFEIFREGLGHYVETRNHEIYTGQVWPGLCAFPNFISSKARVMWKKWIASFAKRFDLDGIWIDMNEPAVFNESKTIDGSALHRTDGGGDIEHKFVHNAYAYFEAWATHDALKSDTADNMQSPFVLSRAGYAGIQKFAATWSGDNTSSWENMRLQIPLLLGLSMSGVPMVGCDVGGFVGRSDPELISRFYEMAALFPIFRNHKSKAGNDQEIFSLPSKYVQEIKRAISLRYSLMAYIYSLAIQSHKLGRPIIRPLAYEFPSDDDAFRVNDEYMLGSNLLYAPHLEKLRREREVYLPEGRWLSWNEPSIDPLTGPGNIKTREEIPLFLREGSVVPTEDRLVIWGRSCQQIWREDSGAVTIDFDLKNLKASEHLNYQLVEFRQSEFERATVDGRESEVNESRGTTMVKTNDGFREIEVL